MFVALSSKRHGDIAARCLDAFLLASLGSVSTWQMAQFALLHPGA